MEEKKEILLPSKRYIKADNQDLTEKINLESSANLLRIGDKDIILDIDQLYDKERNESKNYKIHGKIKMIFKKLEDIQLSELKLEYNNLLTAYRQIIDMYK